MATRQQIDSFHQFATEEVAAGADSLSMDDLYQIWRAKNPTSSERSEIVSALKAAKKDIEAGDHGRPARAALRETCRRLGLVIDE